MNQTVKLKQSKDYDKYECGSGPRPPVPGEESRSTKMIAEDEYSSTSNLNQLTPSPPLTDKLTTDLCERIEKWQKDFFNILDDQEGYHLLRKFVKEDAGEESIDYARLQFYFACRGLKNEKDEDNQRKFTSAIYG